MNPFNLNKPTKKLTRWELTEKHLSQRDELENAHLSERIEWYEEQEETIQKTTFFGALVKKEERERRWNICLECEYLDPVKRCQICGCFMRIKTWQNVVACPLDPPKWHKVYSERQAHDIDQLKAEKDELEKEIDKLENYTLEERVNDKAGPPTPDLEEWQNEDSELYDASRPKVQ